MEVDLVIPEEGLGVFISMRINRARQEIYIYLIAITPEEVLGADVLVRVLRLLGSRGFVGLVLPMSIPSKLSVDAGDDEAGDGDTNDMLVIMEQPLSAGVVEIAMPDASHRFRGMQVIVSDRMTSAG